MNQPSIINNGFLKNNSYDIISNIFSYFDQQDCLNCMETCREWYDLIPQYTEANWKIVDFVGNGISQRQERNLGKHVKHASFELVSECFLPKMMQQLLDCGCTEIESLGKILYKRKGKKIEILKRKPKLTVTFTDMCACALGYFLGFTSCRGGTAEKEQKDFLGFLQLLASHQLTGLAMIDHN